jgi:putative membrane protein
MWHELQHWRGVLLVGLSVVATVWLALSNQLVLYIHPRYIGFTVAMAVLALVLVVASVLSRAESDDDDEAPARGWSRVISGTAIGVATLFAVTMLILPPATLTSATAGQRDINSTTLGAQTQTVEEARDAPADVFANFTVVDWASLLHQTSDPDFYESKPVDVVGFVTADPDDPQNVFYVSRFKVTCCAVDAQPAGIPVYLPNWSDDFAIDSWVKVTGEFTTNLSDQSTEPLAIDPDAVTSVEQPDEPYLY